MMQWRNVIPHIPDYLFVQISSEDNHLNSTDEVSPLAQVDHSPATNATCDSVATSPAPDEATPVIPLPTLPFATKSHPLSQTPNAIDSARESSPLTALTYPTMVHSERMNDYKRRRDSDLYSTGVVSCDDFSDYDDSSVLENSITSSRPPSAHLTLNTVNPRSPRGSGGLESGRGRSRSTIGNIINKVLYSTNAPANHSQSFSTTGYVSPDASSQDLFFKSNGLKIKEVTLAVVDIANFHELVSCLSALQIARLHSDYLDCITSCVRAHKGTVNHIYGDKIVCSWNSAHQVIAHEIAAVSAAFACKTRMARINSRYKASYGFPHVTVNISVVTGTALVGVTGKETLKHFSIFGELFGELISFSKLNKLYNTRILVNEACYKKVSHSFLVRLVDVITICGESKQTDRGIFEAHSEKGTAKSEEWYYTYRKSKDVDQKFTEYNRAWIAYMQGNHDEALECLEQFEAKFPTDPHAARLRKRIEFKMMSNPLLDLTIRLHDAQWRKSGSKTNVLYHPRAVPEKHEKIDLTAVLETGEGEI